MTLPDTVDTDAARPLTTREGCRAFASQRPSAPALLSEAEYAALSDTELDRYNEDRLDHHARLLVVATSTVRHTVTSGRRLILLNRHAVSARRGLIISGPAGTGKTIAITQLGLAHELQDRVRHPDVDDRIPFVYVTVPPAATAGMIAVEFARFLALERVTRPVPELGSKGSRGSTPGAQDPSARRRAPSHRAPATGTHRPEVPLSSGPGPGTG
ncbi:hypothetical protein ACWEF9_37745 [Streptomyces sp. NPDC004980]